MLSADDRWEISDVMSRYCQAADTRQFDLLDQVFTPDAECVYSIGSCAGREEIKKFMAGVLERITATQHNLTSSVVTETPDGAEGQTYLLVQHVRIGEPAGQTYLMGSTYHDQFRRVDGAWRIQHRRLVGTWQAGNPAILRG